MIDRRVAFLRGINVGKAKRVAMADLRRLIEDLGFADVATLLNSGNVVFTVKKSMADIGAVIEKAVQSELGVATKVTILSAKEVARALDQNPLAAIAVDPSKFLVMILAEKGLAKSLAPVVEKSWAPEAVAVDGRIVYLSCPGGIIDSPLQKAVARLVGENGTARNLATMRKLAEMLGAS